MNSTSLLQDVEFLLWTECTLQYIYLVLTGKLWCVWLRLNSSTYPCGKLVWFLMAALASVTETSIAGSSPVMEEPYFIKGSDISFPSLLRDQVLRVVQRCSI